jgi:2-hydroxy-6-oxonona-2,4-dienedioate hydrolase
MAEIVNLNGFDIRFELHGEGTPIVYTPGGFWPLEQGRAVAERLKPLGYKVLLWDRPNTGESGLLFQGENLLRIWADQLHELLHYTGLSPAFVSGGSGGYLASLYFAYAYPSEVRGLILISPPTDNQEILESIMKGTFLETAEIAEQKGMTAVIEAIGGMWDFFDWPDQFERIPQKRQQLLAMEPSAFARTMRDWARSFTAGGRPYFAALTDEQLATINIPTLVFSGLDGFDGLHPQHTAEALHARLPKSTLVITTEHYAEIVEQMMRESEEQGDAPLVGRMDEFVRSIL